jgi:hypothetical protein
MTTFYLTANAQVSICDSLIRKGIRDIHATSVTESRFIDIRVNVCNSNYDTYAKASSAAASGGFDLVGVFGINAASANATNDYATKWSQLCKADYNVSKSDSNIVTYIETINANMLRSFDNCINATVERFIRYVEPSQDGKTFNIIFKDKRGGLTLGFKITQLTLRDTDTGKNLDPAHDCNLEKPLPFDTGGYNSWNIICQKPADHAVIVSAITSAGMIDPVTVPAVPPPPPGAAEQIAKLNGQVETLTEDISKIKVASQNAITNINNDLDKLRSRSLPQNRAGCQLKDSGDNGGHVARLATM